MKEWSMQLNLYMAVTQARLLLTRPSVTMRKGSFRRLLNMSVCQYSATDHEEATISLANNRTMVRFSSRSWQEARRGSREKQKEVKLTSTAICDTGSI
jgi:hypothetical protein